MIAEPGQVRARPSGRRGYQCLVAADAAFKAPASTPDAPPRPRVSTSSRGERVWVAIVCLCAGLLLESEGSESQGR